MVREPKADAPQTPLDLYDAFMRGVRRLLGLPIPERLIRCTCCRRMAPETSMAIQAVPFGDGYWKPKNAAHCAVCAEARALGSKDEDGVHHPRQDAWGRRLRDGFELLLEREFGDVPIEDEFGR